jgi:uroporphyrinogen-III synthase
MSGIVVITRPIADAGPLESDIHARGYQTLIEPMLTIEPRREPLPPLDPFDAIAFTSANGVRAFAELTPRRDMPAFAVGGKTARALIEAGFETVSDAAGDAASLAAVLAQTLGPGARLLHVSGDDIARDLAELLERRSIAVERLPLYRAKPAERLSQGLVDGLDACTIGYVLLFSTRTAAIFGTLLVRAGLADRVRSATSLCLSQAVASEAARLPWKQIGVAQQPASPALLDLLPPLDGFANADGCGQRRHCV